MNEFAGQPYLLSNARRPYTANYQSFDALDRRSAPDVRPAVGDCSASCETAGWLCRGACEVGYAPAACWIGCDRAQATCAQKCPPPLAPQ